MKYKKSSYICIIKNKTTMKNKFKTTIKFEFTTNTGTMISTHTGYGEVKDGSVSAAWIEMGQSIFSKNIILETILIKVIEIQTQSI